MVDAASLGIPVWLLYQLVDKPPEFEQFAIYDFPDDGAVNSMIGMAQTIADIANLAPRDMGVAGLDAVRDVAGGFADDFETAFNAKLKEPVLGELFEVQTSGVSFDLNHRVKHVRQPCAQRRRRHQNTGTSSSAIRAAKSGATDLRNTI